MKKYLVLFLIVIFIIAICSCSAPEPSLNPNPTPETTDPADTDYLFMSGVIYEQICGDDEVGNCGGDIVPDAETAIKIADVLFENAKNKNNRYEKFCLTAVLFDTDKEIWIINYSEQDAPAEDDGYSIAIGKNGYILKVGNW